MKKRSIAIFLLLLLAFSVAIVGAQDIVPTNEDEIDPNFNISFPPPVYTLSGEVEITGTINLPNVANYFVEFRELVLDEPQDAPERPWFPATLPSVNVPVQEGVLGEWNTENYDDGLYEIRLTVNVRGENARFFRVSPLRIDNETFNVAPTREPLLPTPTQLGGVSRPTVVAVTPTVASTSPRVVALVNANVRSGDSTLYPTVGALLDGEAAEILGISTTGSGWYYISLPNNRRGFISPNIVRVEGNVANVQRIDPPPVPATPTPVATATPIASSNIRITGFEIVPASPTCAVEYKVRVNLYNDGPSNTGGPFTVQVVDRHTRTGSNAATSSVSVPNIGANANYLVEVPLTASIYYGEVHRVIATVDSGGVIPELNENDNTFGADYTLQQGGCG